MATDIAVVKKLEWDEIVAARSNEDPTQEPTGDWEAPAPFGLYHIELYFGSDSYGWYVSFDGSRVADKDDPEAAKAAAQADYEQRILSALSQDYLDLKASHDAAVAALRPFADASREYFARNYNESDVVASLLATADGRAVKITVGDLLLAHAVYADLTTPAAPAAGCEYCVGGLQADGETPCPCPAAGGAL